MLYMYNPLDNSEVCLLLLFFDFLRVNLTSKESCMSNYYIGLVTWVDWPRRLCPCPTHRRYSSAIA